MKDGIILVDGRTIGTFVIDDWPQEGLRFKFEEGLKVREYLDHASDNGLVIALQMTPEYGERV